MLEHPAAVPWRRCGSDAAAAATPLRLRHGAATPWRRGTMAPHHGAMMPWCHGATAPWCHGGSAAAALGPGSCAANKNPCYVLESLVPRVQQYRFPFIRNIFEPLE